MLLVMVPLCNVVAAPRDDGFGHSNVNLFWNQKISQSCIFEVQASRPHLRKSKILTLIRELPYLPSPAPPSPSHSLNLRRIPAAVCNHQPVPLRQRLSRPELIHLIEHEREAGAGVRRLAHEPLVGIAQIGRMVQKGKR